MSLDATRWAWLQQGIRPLQKLILLALADRADADDKAFPSYEQLIFDTGADRKTIWQGLKALQEKGLISDCGERKGSTGHVIVWQLEGVQHRLGNSSKSGTIPKTEQFRFSHETVPKTELETVPKTEYGIYKYNLPRNQPLPLQENQVENSGGRGDEEMILGTSPDNAGDGERGAARSGKLAQVQQTNGERLLPAGASAPMRTDLIFPKELIGPERQAAEQLVTPCNGAAQSLLDTLEAAIRAGQVRKSPVAYLGGLVRRYGDGTFDPTGGLHIAAKRSKTTATAQKVKQQNHVDGGAVLRELEELRQQQMAKKAVLRCGQITKPT